MRGGGGGKPCTLSCFAKKQGRFVIMAVDGQVFLVEVFGVYHLSKNFSTGACIGDDTSAAHV